MTVAAWFERKRKERGRRALERQLEYQEEKARHLSDLEATTHRIFMRAQTLRRKLNEIKPFAIDARVLEVGSGSHGLIFGFSGSAGIGVDPLAVDYKRLFPTWQPTAKTVAAIGEELPFDDASFDIVLSDNVIDHAERPTAIVDELVRVLRPGGLLYFTVNIHHPIYDLASRAHETWNALGVKIELSAFADHTVHFTEKQITAVFARQPLKTLEMSSTVPATRAAQRASRALNPDALLKKVFFKNAVFEVIAERL